MIALIRYHLITYMKSSKFIMPLACYIILLLMLCTGIVTTSVPAVVQFFSISMCLAFFFMLWSAFVFTDSEDLIAEQVSILKAGNNKRFYLSKNIFIMAWSALYALIGIIIPGLWYIINSLLKMGSFTGYTFMNVITALIIHICVGVLGAASGFIWHPRIMANRKVAAIGAFSFGAMGLLSGPLAADLGIVPFIKWLFPPVYNVMESCMTNVTALNIGSALLPCLFCLIYTVILVVTNVFILNKKGF